MMALLVRNSELGGNKGGKPPIAEENYLMRGTALLRFTCSTPLLYHSSVRHDGLVGNDDDPVADGVVIALGVLNVVGVDDADVLADPAVFVEDGALDHAPVADAERGTALSPVFSVLGRGLESIRAQHHRVAHLNVSPDLAPDAEDAAVQFRPRLDDTPVGDKALLQLGIADSRGGEITHPRIN